jgi:adenylyl- and sulfurtransferase ThiI
LESLENDPTVNITTKGKISNTINNMKTQLEKYSELTIDQAQILTQQLNKNLESFYKNPNLNDIGSNMVDLLVNNNLKKSIDESIESVLGSNNYSELKQAYGSLRSIEDQVARRAFIDASKNAK